MSVLPNSVTYMTQAIRNARQHHETFHKFFECWLSEQNQHLEELVSSTKNYGEQQQQQQQRHGDDRNSPMATLTEEERNVTIIAPLIRRVVQHYEDYYKAKSRCARNDVLAMFNPSWTSSLEDAFLWIGGWRPSMAFHLLYSKSGLQFEARLNDLIQGVTIGDLGDLSPSQLEKVDELQKETIRQEKEISEKLAKQQETVADMSMVELSHVVTEVMREGEVEQVAPEDEGRVEAALAPKEEGLVETLNKADDLRIKTLKGVIGILSPIQGAHFLIAAAELHLRVHEWGKRRDAKLGNNHHQQQHQHHQ